jgi:hypothetical protein
MTESAPAPPKQQLCATAGCDEPALFYFKKVGLVFCKKHLDLAIEVQTTGKVTLHPVVPSLPACHPIVDTHFCPLAIQPCHRPEVLRLFFYAERGREGWQAQ